MKLAISGLGRIGRATCRIIREPSNAEQIVDRDTPEVRQLARETGIPRPCRNPYMSIVARSLEVVYAAEEALRLIEAYQPPASPIGRWFLHCDNDDAATGK